MGVVHEITIWRSPQHKPVIALVAHDGKKNEMLLLAGAHLRMLGDLTLMATQSTGRMLREELGLEVDCFASGPEGGDMQIGARIVEGGVDAVIFLRDPLTADPHDPDIHGVPLATNRAAAKILLQHIARDAGVHVRGSHPSMFPPGSFPWDRSGP